MASSKSSVTRSQIGIAAGIAAIGVALGAAITALAIKRSQQKKKSSVDTRLVYQPKGPFQTGFPTAKLIASGMLKVSELHSIYWEESGNPLGKPVIILHGGPGGACSPAMREHFNPKKWRIVQIDQRGCGNSTPHAELRENTTSLLVEDIEKVRQHLKIDRWMVLGGSWGSTLALIYAQTHPAHVKALVLRGIFTIRRSEILAFYQTGGPASQLFPELHKEFRDFIPDGERHDLVSAYHRRLTNDKDEKTQLEAAKLWSTWEMQTCKLTPDAELAERAVRDLKWAIAFARIESHYFVNGGFFEREGQIIEQAAAGRLAGIPGIIVQGRYDIVCPPVSAFELHSVWPESQLRMIGDAGHSGREDGIFSELINACEEFSHL